MFLSKQGKKLKKLLKNHADWEIHSTRYMFNTRYKLGLHINSYGEPITISLNIDQAPYEIKLTELDKLILSHTISNYTKKIDKDKQNRNIQIFVRYIEDIEVKECVATDIKKYNKKS